MLISEMVGEITKIDGQKSGVDQPAEGRFTAIFRHFC